MKIIVRIGIKTFDFETLDSKESQATPLGIGQYIIKNAPELQGKVLFFTKKDSLQDKPILITPDTLNEPLNKDASPIVIEIVIPTAEELALQAGAFSLQLDQYDQYPLFITQLWTERNSEESKDSGLAAILDPGPEKLVEHALALVANQALQRFILRHMALLRDESVLKMLITNPLGLIASYANKLSEVIFAIARELFELLQGIPFENNKEFMKIINTLPKGISAFLKLHLWYYTETIIHTQLEAKKEKICSSPFFNKLQDHKSIAVMFEKDGDIKELNKLNELHYCLQEKPQIILQDLSDALCKELGSFDDPKVIKQTAHWIHLFSEKFNLFVTSEEKKQSFLPNPIHPERVKLFENIANRSIKVIGLISKVKEQELKLSLLTYLFDAKSKADLEAALEDLLQQLADYQPSDDAKSEAKKDKKEDIGAFEPIIEKLIEPLKQAISESLKCTPDKTNKLTAILITLLHKMYAEKVPTNHLESLIKGVIQVIKKLKEDGLENEATIQQLLTEISQIEHLNEMNSVTIKTAVHQSYNKLKNKLKNKLENEEKECLSFIRETTKYFPVSIEETLEKECVKQMVNQKVKLEITDPVFKNFLITLALAAILQHYITETINKKPIDSQHLTNWLNSLSFKENLNDRWKVLIANTIRLLKNPLLGEEKKLISKSEEDIQVCHLLLSAMLYVKKIKVSPALLNVFATTMSKMDVRLISAPSEPDIMNFLEVRIVALNNVLDDFIRINNLDKPTIEIILTELSLSDFTKKSETDSKDEMINFLQEKIILQQSEFFKTKPASSKSGTDTQHPEEEHKQRLKIRPASDSKEELIEVVEGTIYDRSDLPIQDDEKDIIDFFSQLQESKATHDLLLQERSIAEEDSARLVREREEITLQLSILKLVLLKSESLFKEASESKTDLSSEMQQAFVIPGNCVVEVTKKIMASCQAGRLPEAYIPLVIERIPSLTFGNLAEHKKILNNLEGDILRVKNKEKLLDQIRGGRAHISSYAGNVILNNDVKGSHDNMIAVLKVLQPLDPAVAKTLLPSDIDFASKKSCDEFIEFIKSIQDDEANEKDSKIVSPSSSDGVITQKLQQNNQNHARNAKGAPSTADVPSHPPKPPAPPALPSAVLADDKTLNLAFTDVGLSPEETKECIQIFNQTIKESIPKVFKGKNEVDIKALIEERRQLVSNIVMEAIADKYQPGHIKKLILNYKSFIGDLSLSKKELEGLLKNDLYNLSQIAAPQLKYAYGR